MFEQSPSDAVSTTTLVEFKSAATIYTVKFPFSVATLCTENPPDGGVLLWVTFATGTDFICDATNSSSFFFIFAVLIYKVIKCSKHHY